MLSPFIHHPYPLQVILCSALFWGFYKIVVEPGRHFAFSRSFLLFSLIAPIVLPLLSIPLYKTTPAIWDNVYTISMEETTVQAESTPYQNIPLCIYLSVTGILCFRLCRQLWALQKLTRSGTRERGKAYSVVYSAKVSAPFSFWHTIYLPDPLAMSEKELFLMHESAHIRNRHSFDILINELILIFFWFNPIFWLTKRTVKNIHEYQVDRTVLRFNPNIGLYKTLIVKEFLGIAPKITHNFNGSLTKKRIMMLTKPFQTNLIALRGALVIPFAALNFFLFSCTSQQQQHETDTLTTKAVSSEVVRFEIVDTKPQFQGGDENTFGTWIGKHIEYPLLAKENGIEGRVTLSFVVDTDGSITDISVLRGVDPALDKEAVRVVASAPKWTPGMNNGQIVKVQYNFPVIFLLTPSKTRTVTSTPQPSSAPASKSYSTSEKGVYRFDLVEVKPKFQGGDENDFGRWVGKHVEYPLLAKEKGIQGRVTLSFVVDTDGSVTDVTVLRSIDPALDKESVRVVSSSPKWTPGMNKGEAVKVRYNFPVIFQLK